MVFTFEHYVLFENFQSQEYKDQCSNSDSVTTSQGIATYLLNLWLFVRKKKMERYNWRRHALTFYDSMKGDVKEVKYVESVICYQDYR